MPASVQSEPATAQVPPLVALAFDKAVDFVAATNPSAGEPSEAVEHVFQSFLAIVRDGESAFLALTERERLAAVWATDDDPAKDERTLYAGYCLGTMTSESSTGGKVTRIAIWVPPFDKAKECSSASEARDLWAEYRSDQTATARGGILYRNGLKIMRLPFGDEFKLDRSGAVSAAAKTLFGQRVTAYREFSYWAADDGETQKVNVCHRVAKDLSRDDSGDEAAAQEPAPVQQAPKRSNRSRAVEEPADTGTGVAEEAAPEAPAPKSRSNARTTAASAADGDAPSSNGAGTPANRTALSKWIGSQGIKRPAVARYLLQCGFENGLGDAKDADTTAEVYEAVVAGIEDGSLGV